MAFPNLTFLFFFFPIFFFCYYGVSLLSKDFKWKNFLLLLFSFLFYAFGDLRYLPIILISTFLNYFLSNQYSKTKKKKYYVTSLIFHIGLLFLFKYLDFQIGILNSLFSFSIPYLHLGLPLGISFYIFSEISYLIDVKEKRVKPAKDYKTYLLYISMFPKLISGPIVRYEDVEKDLTERSISYHDFNEGILRFLRGLFKKVLLANEMGTLWNTILLVPSNELSFSTAWLGLFTFTLYIYFDFSSYSDMAIGLARMLGFHFKENFHYPYCATSIKEFWKRWHISLSSWFKDYVYIPLGGSRRKFIFQVRNILIVWILTGLWHGASWNFILWGLYFGILLLFEKYVWGKWIQKWKPFWKHLYAMFFVSLGWILFAITDLKKLGSYVPALFGFSFKFFDHRFFFYLKDYALLFIFGILFSMPVYPLIRKMIEKKKMSTHPIYALVLFLFYTLLFLLVISSLLSDSYHPFYYFRF